MSVSLRSMLFKAGIKLIYDMAKSSIMVWDSDKVSRFGTFPAKIPTPEELTVVQLRFRCFKFSPTDAINPAELSPMAVELRSKCSNAFIWGKKQNLWREAFEKSRWFRKLVPTNSRSSVSFENVAPEAISFLRGTLAPDPLIVESITQLLTFRDSRWGKFGNLVTLVQAIFRKFNFRNICRTSDPVLDILLPQRSRYCNFVST